MTTLYKIHPAIGIGRVGSSTESYFIQSEVSGGSPFEIDTGGNEIAFQGYKDANKLIRRQGVRFRIFEYSDDNKDGEFQVVREITSDIAKISWSVELANRKSAELHMTSIQGPEGEGIVVPNPSVPSVYRNNPSTGGSREDLVGKVNLNATSEKQSFPDRQFGTIQGEKVFLGETTTDIMGRLIVVGGEGKAGSWKTPAPIMPNYLNNPDWYDDTADGKVDAEIEFVSGGDPIQVQRGAWVIIGPPDFAPDITPIITLADVIQDRVGSPPSNVSFKLDILPIIERAASYSWVNDHAKRHWDRFMELLNDPEEMLKLSSNSDVHLTDRSEIHKRILDIQKNRSHIREFRFTQTQKRNLFEWQSGNFIPDADASRLSPSLPLDLDLSALNSTIGRGFFPGIEAGYIMTYSSLYQEPFRITRGSFEDFDGKRKKIESGMLTSRMAVPWQADFVECQHNWWPAQRPDAVRFNEQGDPLPNGTRWDRKIVAGGSPASPESHQNMVDHFAKLGVIEKMEIGGKTIYAEVGRASDEEFD